MPCSWGSLLHLKAEMKGEITAVIHYYSCKLHGLRNIKLCQSADKLHVASLTKYTCQIDIKYVGDSTAIKIVSIVSTRMPRPSVKLGAST